MNIIDNNYYENGAVHNDHRRNISIDAGAADAAEILRRILGEDEDFADYEVIGRQEEHEPAQGVRSRMFTTNMTDGNGKPADSVCQTRKGIGCIDPSKPVSLAILLRVAQEVGAVRADTGNTTCGLYFLTAGTLGSLAQFPPLGTPLPVAPRQSGAHDSAQLMGGCLL